MSDAIIRVGRYSEYRELVDQEYGDDIERLKRALAFCMKHREQLQNRVTAYHEDRAPPQ
jgi:hypothetical protein